MTQTKVRARQVSLNIDDLQDVNVVTPTTGEVLTYNNGTWESAPAAGGDQNRPRNEVVLGGTQSLDSSSSFTYSLSTGALIVNSTLNALSPQDMLTNVTYVIASLDGGQLGGIVTDFTIGGAPINDVGRVFVYNGVALSGDGLVYPYAFDSANMDPVVLPGAGVIIRSGLNANFRGGSTLLFTSPAKQTEDAGLSSVVLESGQDIDIVAGSPDGNFENGGTVTIKAGVSTGYSSQNGTVIIETGGNIRYQVDEWGTLLVAGNAGSSGQVLKSRGSSNTPEWGDPPVLPPSVLQYTIGDETTVLTVGTNKFRVRIPYTFVITEIRGSLSTAQTTGNRVIVDVNINGTTVFNPTFRLSFDNNSRTTRFASVPSEIAPINGFTVAEDEELSVDIDQIGAATVARGLKITIYGIRV